MCLMAMISLAQVDCDFNYGEFKVDRTVCLFGDKVNVRSKPSTTATVVANLPIGTEVTIVEKTDVTFTIGGYNTNWYYVKFLDKGEEKTGYVWGGLISMASIKIPNPGAADDLFVCSITSWTAQTNFTMTGRLVRNGQVIHTIDFEPISMGFFDPGEYHHCVCIGVSDGHGFKGVKNIVSLEFVYGACGYENGKILLFWDGSKLYYAGKASAVFEAGVFNYFYSIVYPDDEKNGLSNILKIVQTYEEYVASPDDPVPSDTTGMITDESGWILKREVTLKQYHWDGSKMIALPEEKVTK